MIFVDWMWRIFLSFWMSFWVSLFCVAFCVYCEKCGGVSFSVSAARLLLPLLSFSSMPLFLLSSYSA